MVMLFKVLQRYSLFSYLPNFSNKKSCAIYCKARYLTSVYILDAKKRSFLSILLLKSELFCLFYRANYTLCGVKMLWFSAINPPMARYIDSFQFGFLT